jgi:hypothetical protein
MSYNQCGLCPGMSNGFIGWQLPECVLIRILEKADPGNAATRLGRESITASNVRVRRMGEAG